MSANASVRPLALPAPAWSPAGIVVISAGAVADGTLVLGGATDRVVGVESRTTANNGGSAVVFSGGIASSTVINGGTEIVSTGGVAIDPSMQSSGTLILRAGATVGGTISFVGTNDTLATANPTPPANTISGFAPADVIDLTTLAYNVANTVDLLPGNVLQITIAGGGTETLQLATTDNYAGMTFELKPGTFGGTNVIVHS